MNDLNQLLQEANEKVKRLTYAEASQVIAKEKNLIIDVREESEVTASGLIKGAINIPKSLFDNNFSKDLIENHIDDIEQTKVLLYCAVGVRSALVGLTLINNGYKNILNIGGYLEWVSSNGPIECI
ncbi:MAG: rhodanese-like domain-containing protein [Proteobacteria bacterium]|nr:rhodanese-like domain-containing protein [Pseudomonadota bacterium]MDA1037960.1 rhodanese-like domain-containing protein [Pseudomonadota bacterium]